MNTDKKKQRILIVEDDPKLAHIIETTLKYAGMSTYVAEVHNGWTQVESS
jgi:DNA-binding response OmpR family regulator